MQKIKIYSVLFCVFTSLACFFCNGMSGKGYTGSFAPFAARSYSTSFLLHNITFQSDVPFSSDEFFYLTDLKPQKLTSCRQVERAYHMLVNKRRFNTITIDISEDPSGGKNLHFTLASAWILKKLDFSGIWFGKPKYTILYTQQPGDVFDATLHEESVKAIKQFLQDQGYFNSMVYDELVYEKKYKMITAKVRINRNRRFIIRSVNYEIENVRVKDFLNKRFTASLRDALYSRDLIQKQAKKVKDFLKKAGFLRARIMSKYVIEKDVRAIHVTFNVSVDKRRSLTFQGNSVFSGRAIRDDIIGLDQPDWLFSPDIIKEQIRYEYYKKGYWNPVISHQKRGDLGYHFVIQEGKPVTIEAIVLKDSITQLPEPSPISIDELLSQKIFDQQLLDEWLDRLKNFYLTHGYWDFAIADKRFIKNPETGNYTIQLLIDKGSQRFWGGVVIEGMPELEQHEFFKKYKLSHEDQLVNFDIRWIADQRVFLLSHFQKLGYWYADVHPEILVLDFAKIAQNKQLAGATKVSLVWKVTTGEQVTFGKVFLRGNSRLPFKRILKEIKCKDGEPWRREKIDLTRKKLKRLGIFKAVQIQPYQMTKNKSKKPVILTLVDDDPLELRLRVGYFLTSKNFMFRRQSTPKLGTSLIFRNPTNRADKIAVDFDWTNFERTFNVDYQQPSFFNYSVMTRFKGYANKYIHPVRIGKSDSAYEALQNGLLFGFSDEYKQDYHWGVNVGNEWIKISRVRGYLRLDKPLIDHVLPYAFVEPTLVIDKLDDRINTTKGGLTFVSIKCMIPEDHGSVTARLTAEQSFFYPIYKDFIGAARVRFGHVFRRAFGQIMPLERFYLGGPNSVRGYEIDSLPPLGVTEKGVDGKIIKEYSTNGVRDVLQARDKNITKDYTIQGGSSMFNANFELRFGLIKDLGAVLFQDIGVLSQSGLAGFKSVWFPSSGFGLRYKTPIGAIRFDIGWKWKKRFDVDRNSPYMWYLSLGQAF